MREERVFEETERVSMQARRARGVEKTGMNTPPQRIRLFMGMVLALIILVVLVMAMNPGAPGSDEALLSQAMLSEKAQVDIDSEGLAARVVEQKFQIHMEEIDQQMGEIPYVEVWVLNDPFYPLIGEVGDLRASEGTLSSKEWQMLGFPDYEGVAAQGTTGGAPASSTPTSSLPVTTGIPQRVVLVEEVYEIRGIRYADIKVNDNTYDKLKAGSEFSEVFRLQEIRDDQIVIVLCGDETYELKVNQLRKI
jgi:hypothetical protein